MTNPTDPAQAFLNAARDKARTQKALADRAIAQLDERQLRTRLCDHTNSIAIIMKHVGGNLRSRWTDFLTADGEKPDRQRDQEFVDDFPDRAAIIAAWERGWSVFLETLRILAPRDLSRRVRIRGHELTVAAAILRAIEHNGYHVGQITLLARHAAGENWQTLTIAPNRSAAFNAETWGPHSPRPDAP